MISSRTLDVDDAPSPPSSLPPSPPNAALSRTSSSSVASSARTPSAARSIPSRRPRPSRSTTANTAARRSARAPSKLVVWGWGEGGEGEGGEGRGAALFAAPVLARPPMRGVLVSQRLELAESPAAPHFPLSPNRVRAVLEVDSRLVE
jgi:hypothetical protein